MPLLEEGYKTFCSEESKLGIWLMQMELFDI